MLTIRRPPLVCTGLFGAFVLISVLVVFEGAVFWDDELLAWMGSIRTPALTDVMLFFSLLGDGAIEVPLVFGVIVLLWKMGRPVCARRLFLAGLIGELIFVVAKAFLQRPRPRIIEHLGKAGWYSYPSGHTMLAPIIWSLSLLLIARSITLPLVRLTLYALALIIPIGIGISRIYLGVHYPSDVLGGLLLGTAWMLLWTALPLPSSKCSASSVPAT